MVRDAVHSYISYANSIYRLRHFDSQTASRRQSAWRLLIFDSHVSHLSLEFITYCETANIIPFCLPSHSTHLLQPLDIIVFQPMKPYHARAVEDAVRNGDVEFSRSTFLAAFQSIRQQTFKKGTITSAWKNAGLVPYNPQIVLDTMARLEPLQQSPTPERMDDVQLDSFLTTPHGQQFMPHQDHVTKQLEITVNSEAPLSPTLVQSTSKLLKGLGSAAFSGQLAIDELMKRKELELMKTARKKGGDRILQKGGVIKVGNARLKIQQRETSELELAHRQLERAPEKRKRACQRVGEECAKLFRLRIKRIRAVEKAEIANAKH
jgi:hypothetical protein